MAIWAWMFPPRPPHGRAVERELGRHARTPIGSIEDGTARKIIGRVELDFAPIRSPLYQVSCVAWSVTIEEVGGMGDSVLRGAKCFGHPFRVRDGSGVARVLPDGGRIGGTGRASTHRQSSYSREAFHPSAFLQSTEHALFTELAIQLNYPQSSALRFVERIIPPEGELAVYGYGQREPDRAAMDADIAGYRGDVPMCPVLSSTRRAPLLLAPLGIASAP